MCKRFRSRSRLRRLEVEVEVEGEVAATDSGQGQRRKDKLEFQSRLEDRVRGSRVEVQGSEGIKGKALAKIVVGVLIISKGQIERRAKCEVEKKQRRAARAGTRRSDI